MGKLLLTSLKSLFTGAFLILAFASWNTAFGQATVTTDKDDYAPGEYVIITGSGWEPGERVDFTFVETPKPESCVNSHDNFAIADANGNIYYDGFLIKDNHLGVHFVLTATGQISKRVAVTEFTDANIKFAASGLPPGISISVTASYTNESGTAVSNQPVGPFFTPSLSDAIAVLKNTTITYTFPIILGYSGPPANSTFTLPDNNGARTITGIYTATATTSLVAGSATGTYGGTTTLMATLTSGSPAIGVSGKTINFSLNGTIIGTAVTNGSGIATLNNANLSGINAGSYPTGVSASFNADGTHGGSTGSNSLTVNKATPTATLVVSNSPQTYTGLGQSATVSISASSVPGTVTNILTGGSASQTNANTYAVTANFIPNDAANYNSLTALSAGDFVIGKATPTATLAVSNSPQTYTGAGQSATVIISASSVPGTVTNILTGGLATQTNANTYAVTADFVPTDAANYNSLTALPAGDFVIGKATATINTTPYNGVYDAVAHTASGTATGVGGVDLSGSLTFESSFTDVPGGITNWSFDAGTNYNTDSGTEDVNITAATATINTTPYNGVYDAVAHTASGTATGVGGVDLSGSLTFESSFTDVPGGITNWSFDAGTNYNTDSGTEDVNITAATATINTTPYNGVYDAVAHTASGTATGVGGVDLSGSLTFESSFTDVPGGITNWSFDAGTNYNTDSGTEDVNITAATATINTTPYNGVYDAVAHTASGTATGVGGVDLSGSLTFESSFTDVPGGITNWSFDAGTNYNTDSGTEDVNITAATATINTTPYNGVYDAVAHTASGTATGVGGVDLSGSLTFESSFTDVPGGITNWSFDAGTNYNTDSGTEDVNITAATATINTTPYNGVYDAVAHTASGTATGVGGVDLSGSLTFESSFTDVPGGITNWSFDAGTNYNTDSGTEDVNITAATATINTTPYNGVYDAVAHTASGTATGVGGVDLSGSLTFESSFTDVPGGITNWSFDAGTNYNTDSGTEDVNITAATATINTTPYNGVYDAVAHTASGTATGVGGVDLSGSLTFESSFTDVPGGITNWSFDAGTNYNTDSGTEDVNITAATATINTTPYNGVYDAVAHTASGTATGVGGVDLSGSLTFESSFTDVPGGITNWSFDAGTNYNTDSGTEDVNITAATATINTTPYNGVYDAVAHTASGTATGVGGVDLSGSLTFESSFTDVPGGITNWSFDAGTNYNTDSGTEDVNITAATATINTTPYNGVYDAVAHTASGTATGVGGVDLSGSLTFESSFTDVPGGITNWSFDAGTNYNTDSGTEDVNITAATATINTTPYNGVYDAVAHTASGTATGVGGVDLSGSLTFESSFTDVPGGITNWSFDAGTNYNTDSGTEDVNITAATATINTTPYNGVYDAVAHTASGTATGVGGVDLSGSLTFESSFTDVPGGITNWSFDAGTNYNTDSGTEDVNITAATATINTTPYNGVYDAVAHTASGTATGVGGVDLSGSLTFESSFTDVPGGITNWSFDAGTNYNTDSGTEDVNITAATATINTTPYNGVYDAVAHTASGTATGVGGVDLSGSLTFESSFTDVPGGITNWSFDAGTNYNTDSGTEDVNITAATATINTTPYNGVYDAVAHTASGTATGVGGVDLSGSLTFESSFTDVPGGITNWSFDAGTNYNTDSGTEDVNITAATATINTTPYNGVYDAVAHTASGTATGVGGVDLSGSLTFESSFTDVPGGITNWSFDAGTNYNTDSGTEDVNITAATATINTTPYNGVYDAVAHTASGTATGVGGVDLSGSLTFESSFTDVPGGITNWSFDAGTNYNTDSGTEDVNITAATATINTTPYNGVYDAVAHTASGTATGVGGVDLSGSLTFESSFTDVPGGITNWSFDAGTNYNTDSGTEDVNITAATATINTTPYNGVYDAVAHTASGTATGVGGVDLSGSLTFESSFTDVPGGITNWSFDAGTNYNTDSGTEDVNITAATATINTTPYNGVYDAVAHTASGTATGVGGVDLSGSLTFESSFTDVPGGITNWSFDAGTNYNTDSGTEDVNITAATATINTTPYNGVYDAVAHTASGTATGVGGVDLSGSLTFESSFTDVPGGITNWSFDAGTNYNTDSGTEDVNITAATATINTTPYNGVYDAVAHTASGTATGVGGVDLSGSLTFESSFTDVPGGITNWSFDAGTNYNTDSGTEDVNITAATATINTTPYNGVYDAVAHTASGTATGVGGVDLSGSLTFESSFTDVPGGITNWSFDAGTNYNTDSGTEDVNITAATATINTTPYNGVYDAVAHTASGTATGVGGVDLSGSLTFESSFTDVPGGITNWSFDAGTNYNTDSGTEDVNITAATATINTTPYNGVYDAVAHTASGTATGVGGVDLSGSLTFESSFTDVPGGITNWSFDAGTNYNTDSGTEDVNITAATATINTTPYNGVYDAVAHTASGTATGVGGVDLSGSLTFESSFTDVPGGITNWSFDAGTNYNTDSGTEDVNITPRRITITGNSYSKFCGQDDPDPTIFVYSITSGDLVGTDSFTGNLIRVAGEAAGTYAIGIGSLTLGDNYEITLESGVFTIIGLSSLDVLGSFVNVQIGGVGTLSATVTPKEAGIPVTFTFYRDGSNLPFGEPLVGITNSTGVATVTWTAPTNIEVFRVEVMAGSSACGLIDEAYVTVFDPSASFVTGGGWFISPEKAMPANLTAVGKASFGFVSKYKKGRNNTFTNEVDGNTEFQFQAGDLNFKSTMHESGSLVISGSKATYRGSGTVNGQTGFKFLVVAIDGNLNGQTTPDSFRIKITSENGGTVIYDNQIGKAENASDATILGNNGTGGGSIVIHEVKAPAKGNKRVVTDLVSVPWNTPTEVIENKIAAMSTDWFEGKGIKLNINAESYNPLAAGLYEMKVDVLENEWFELEEPISVNVLVADKPLPTDIRLSNSILLRNIQSGTVIGDLITIDPVDDQHTLSIAAQADFELVGKSLIWKGTVIPSTARITVFSTDRAGQTIERVLELSREPRFGDFNMFPNPAQSDVNLEIELDQTTTVGIRIYDAVGRLVHEQEGVQSGSPKYLISIDHLSPGLYTVQVKTGQIVMNKRLIKK